MKRRKIGLIECVLMGVGLVGFALLLPILIPIELWMRYRENRELKRRMNKDV